MYDFVRGICGPWVDHCQVLPSGASQAPEGIRFSLPVAQEAESLQKFLDVLGAVKAPASYPLKILDEGNHHLEIQADLEAGRYEHDIRVPADCRFQAQVRVNQGRLEGKFNFDPHITLINAIWGMFDADLKTLEITPDGRIIAHVRFLGNQSKDVTPKVTEKLLGQKSSRLDLPLSQILETLRQKIPPKPDPCGQGQGGMPDAGPPAEGGGRGFGGCSGCGCSGGNPPRPISEILNRPSVRYEIRSDVNVELQPLTGISSLISHRGSLVKGKGIDPAGPIHLSLHLDQMILDGKLVLRGFQGEVHSTPKGGGWNLEIPEAKIATLLFSPAGISRGPDSGTELTGITLKNGSFELAGDICHPPKLLQAGGDLNWEGAGFGGEFRADPGEFHFTYEDQGTQQTWELSQGALNLALAQACHGSHPLSVRDASLVDAFLRVVKRENSFHYEGRGVPGVWLTLFHSPKLSAQIRDLSCAGVELTGSRLHQDLLFQNCSLGPGQFRLFAKPGVSTSVHLDDFSFESLKAFRDPAGWEVEVSPADFELLIRHTDRIKGLTARLGMEGGVGLGVRSGGDGLEMDWQGLHATLQGFLGKGKTGVALKGNLNAPRSLAILQSQGVRVDSPEGIGVSLRGNLSQPGRSTEVSRGDFFVREIFLGPDRKKAWVRGRFSAELYLTLNDWFKEGSQIQFLTEDGEDRKFRVTIKKNGKLGLLPNLDLGEGEILMEAVE